MAAMNILLRVICPSSLSEQDKIVANCIIYSKPFILLKVCETFGEYEVKLERITGNGYKPAILKAAV